MLIYEKLQRLVSDIKGSSQSAHDRLAINQKFIATLKKNGHHITKFRDITPEHIKDYIDEKREKGIGKRRLQNEMAAIRSVLKKAGNFKTLNSALISNEALNITKACRDKTRVAIPESKYQEILAKAFEKDDGLAVLIQLSRLLGLTTIEALESVNSIHTWKKAIESGKTHLSVIFGRQSGQPRQVIIIHPQKLLEVIDLALHIMAKRGGKLLKKDSLKSSIYYWQYHTSRMGLNGKFSPYSLRYAWAQDALAFYESQGHSHRKALILVSVNLGHQDGIGRFVKDIPWT